MKAEAVRQWQRPRRRRQLIVALAAIGILLAAAGAAVYFFWSANQAGRAPNETATTSIGISSTVRLNLPPPDLLRPISPEEALKKNMERAFSGRPDTPAAPFTLKADAITRERALECMTQAIYFEAATEGVDGQRAVAQVVLNRMRHPAYPHSVCGVVYQGSDRPTGCQFTFTCDGSLARVPLQPLWKQAGRIASEALGGKVYGPVGHSTHYHADYVLPYWADSLDKSIQVGRHIFYRLKSGLGASGTFRARYAGVEPLPPPPTTVEVSLEALENADNPVGPIPASPLQVSAGELITTSEPKSQLMADALKGTLIIDGKDRPRTPAVRPSDSAGCTTSGASKPLRPLGVNDVRARSRETGC